MNEQITAQLRSYPDMLTPPDVTKILCISKTSTYRLLSENIIPNIKVGRVYRIPKIYLIQYMTRNLSTSAAEFANPIISPGTAGEHSDSAQ